MDTATVLVVEDDDTIAELIGINLEMEGFAVCRAPDGAEALKAVEREEPDLILLDVKMPFLDGWAVLRRLQAELSTASIPVMVLSASAPPEPPPAGAAGYLAKPFSSQELVGAVRTALATR